MSSFIAIAAETESQAHTIFDISSFRQKKNEVVLPVNQVEEAESSASELEAVSESC